jgi:hypothetical protein
MADPPGAFPPRPDKRDGERLPILGELNGEIMVFQPLAVREIGHRGAQVETAFPLQPDSLHEVRLTLGEHSLVVRGRVAHCSISDVDQDVVTYRSGVEFVEMADHVAAAIGRFIAAIKESRRAV